MKPARRVTLHVEEPGIAFLTLNDPHKKNTFHQAAVTELIESLTALGAQSEVKVCLIRGLPEIFCAGASQELLLDLAEGTGKAASDIVLPKFVLDLPMPTIAAMEGHAIGGGLALGLCCDIVLMAQESRYGCSFMNMGFTPGMGITRLLQLAVGEYRASEMMFGGQYFKGSHFAGASNINYILPRQKVWPKALQLAQRIAEKPRMALEALKRYLSLPRRQAFEETRTMEPLMHQLSFAQPGIKEQIQEHYAAQAETDGKRHEDS
jgi:polyketide biosynthesis enoyl-CoA hydratase PksI